MILSIRPTPIPLLIAAVLALCLAVALATFPTAPAHAQSGTPAVSIRTDLTEVSEGRPVVFTLTRTGGDVSSPLTVNVAVADPGDVMRGDPWEGDPTLPTQAVFEANQSSATLTLATRQNLRDTPDQTLAVSLEEGSGYDVSLPLRASVTVADDDTAPEVSLSVDKTGAVEGDFLTFTLTRHGDTSQAMDSIVLTIGPNRARHNAARYRVDRPQDYGATMAPGVATAQVTVQVMEVVTRSPESDFRYQARIKASRPIPGNTRASTSLCAVPAPSAPW